jgi:hypothetical protein
MAKALVRTTPTRFFNPLLSSTPNRQPIPLEKIPMRKKCFAGGFGGLNQRVTFSIDARLPD